MNFPQNKSEMDCKNNSKMNYPLKNSISYNRYKIIPSNQLTIDFTKDSNNSEFKKIDMPKNTYIPTV